MEAMDFGARPRVTKWDIGGNLRGYAWAADDARAAILLQHGFGEYAERYVDQYNRLIPHLLRANFNVYALDMRGHGVSDPKAVVDVRTAVEDHMAARRRLRNQPLPVFVIGHSLGGLVTAASVAKDPDNTAGAIISSGAFPFNPKRLTRSVSHLLAWIAPAAPTPLPGAHIGGLSRLPAHAKTVTEDTRMYKGKLSNLVADSALITAIESWRLFPSWNVPTLILHGTADTYTNPQGSQLMFQTIASEDKTFASIEGGYHELLNDIDADEVLQTMLQWLHQRQST